jgi:hypothetical protein
MTTPESEVAKELAAIRELLAQIAGCLFHIAEGASQEENGERTSYLDGSKG